MHNEQSNQDFTVQKRMRIEAKKIAALQCIAPLGHTLVHAGSSQWLQAIDR